MLINAEGLNKQFGHGENSIWALKDITMSISAGELIAVSGPSGCGKTTVLNILGLVLPPTNGNLVIDGLPLRNLNENKRASYRNQLFGYIVQDFALIEEASVYSNIEIPLLYATPKINRSNRSSKITEAITQLGLKDRLHEKVKKLSGGQRQRVAIARAIVNNPEIILADEPTGSLDTETGNEVMSILKSLVSEGKTIVLVTHNPEIADQCQRRVLMADGRIISDK